MRTVQDHSEVTIDCRRCGSLFTTSDPLTIICDACADDRPVSNVEAAAIKLGNLPLSYMDRNGLPKSTIEYFEMDDSTPWTRVTMLATVDVTPDLTVTLSHHSAGYQIAGSAAIWRPESWRVGRLFRGLASGQYYPSLTTAYYYWADRCRQ